MSNHSRSILTRSGLLTLMLAGVVSACAGDTLDVRVASSTVLYETSTMARGKEHFAAGRYGLALTEFRSAVANSPMSIEALNALAATYDQIQRFDLADQFYQRALVHAPDSSQTLNNVGYSYMLRGKFDVASAYLREAQRIDALNATVTANLAIVGVEAASMSSAELVEPEVLTEVATEAGTGQRALLEALGTRTVVDSTVVTAIGRPTYQKVDQESITLSAARRPHAPESDESKIHVLAARTQFPAGAEKIDTDLNVAVRGSTPDRRPLFGTTVMAVSSQLAGPEETSPKMPEATIQVIAARQIPLFGTTEVNVSREALDDIAADVTHEIAVRATASPRAPLFGTGDVAFTGERADGTGPAPSSSQIEVRGASAPLTALFGTTEIDVSARPSELQETEIPEDQNRAPAAVAGRVPLFGTASVSLTSNAGTVAGASSVRHNIAFTALPAPAVAPLPLESEEAETYAPVPAAMLLEPKIEPAIAESYAVYEVSNGAGRRSMAARMKAFLAGTGITVARLSNAPHFSHMQSSIFFKPGRYEEAQLLADVLPIEVSLTETSSQRADIRLELGGDLLKFDAKLYYGKGI